MTNLSLHCEHEAGEIYRFRISLSSVSTSPCFRLEGVPWASAPALASSASVHSTTSHSTFTPLSVCPPRCCLKRPRLVLRTISSNHGAPRAAGSERLTSRDVFDRAGPADALLSSSSSLLSLCRKPSSASSSWSSSSKLPTVKLMCSASSRVRSFQDDSCVPQYPQNTRRWFCVKGDTKDRWMLDRVSSGNCAKVADVYQSSGTRNQSVSGLAE